MNVKEMAELLRQEKYNEFCNACEDISPRAIHYIFDYTQDRGNFQKKLFENVSPEQFKKWRYTLSGEAENEYIQKNNLDFKGYFYELSPEEKLQACL